jgi:polysaccharide export outer membrane protein
MTTICFDDIPLNHEREVRLLSSRMTAPSRFGCNSRSSAEVRSPTRPNSRSISSDKHQNYCDYTRANGDPRVGSDNKTRCDVPRVKRASSQEVHILRCGVAVCLLLAAIIIQSSHAQALPSMADSPSIAAPQTHPLSITQGTRSELRISPGDLLEISIFNLVGSPELTSKARVSAQGEISIPLLGSVNVSGLTTDQAGATIGKRFVQEEVLRNPHVVVFVSEYANRDVFILGEVAKPGRYSVLVERRLLELISEAGGLTPTAGGQVTITHRDAPQDSESLNLSHNPSQMVTENVEIGPGDTIVVSKAGIVYVVGAVQKPGGFVMDENQGITVLQAIALAQGSRPEAALNKSELIRKTPNNQKEIPIALSKILAGKAPDTQLRADDILFVPTSAAKSAARRSLDAAIQAAVGVTIYRRY